MHIQKIDINSQDYPKRLRDMKDTAPKILYCIGDVSLLNAKNTGAVVGTRRPSPYGRWVTGELSKALVKTDFVTVGGLSAGIQELSHAITLANNGKSIAVLGTGVDVCYPMNVADTYKALAEQGLIISEYEPGTIGQASNFPKRNIIIAALSDEVYVVEGTIKSGTGIIANSAIQYSRDIYAVPGNINQPNSILPNRLLFNGAIPVTMELINEMKGANNND